MSFLLQIDEQLFDQIFPFSFVLNRDMNIVYAGRSLQKLNKQVVGTPFSAFFKVKRPRSASASFQSIISFSKQIFILETVKENRALRFRGQMIAFDEDHLAFLGSPWLNNTDDIQHYGLSLHDYALHDSMPDMLQFLKVKEIVNEDIQMLNEQLEFSENRYRELVERGSDIIYKLNALGEFFFMNDVAARKLACNKTEVLGKHYSVFIPADWKKKVAKQFDLFLNIPDTDHYFEFPIETQTGERIWVGQHTQVTLNNKGQKEIRAFAKDITKRKLIEHNLRSTELRLSSLIANLQSGILVEDETRHIVLTNPFFCELFGIPALSEQLIGMDCSNAAEESKRLFVDPEAFVQKIEETLYEKRVQVGEELHMIDGRFLERDYIPIYSEGKYLGHLWQYRDLTDKKRVEEELIRAHQEAEAAKEAEKQFLAHMSHEIRTPLNAIIGMLHLLMNTELTEEQHSFLEIQKSSTEILYGLINDILDISKIESGKLEVFEKKMNINSILESQYKTFQHQLMERPIEIRWNPLVELDEYVLGDDLLLNQILFNLLGNAIKFTERGVIELKAELVKKTAAFQRVKFTVSDSGIGIPKEKLQVIFERFKQADDYVSVRYGGSGLGLAITKKIIDQLGGKIDLSSTVGEGSSFTVTLDFKRTGEKIDRITRSKDDKKFELVRKGMHFLVAEDNFMNTFYLKSIFSKLDLEVDYVVNGLEAWKKTRETLYDLILMDIRMPEMDGLVATQKIRHEKNVNRNTPIIALTASAFNAQVDKAMNAGTNDYLAKPFTPDQLLRKINYLTTSETITNRSAMEVPATPFTDQWLDELYGGDLEMAREIYQLFVEENLPLFEQIEGHLDLGDYPVARELAHKIKPSLSMIGLPDLHQKMDVFEEMCLEASSDALSFYRQIKTELETNLITVVKYLGEKK